MAVHVVDGLEAVEIDEARGDQAAPTRLHQFCFELAPIRQAGELIGERHPLKLGFDGEFVGAIIDGHHHSHVGLAMQHSTRTQRDESRTVGVHDTQIECPFLARAGSQRVGVIGQRIERPGEQFDMAPDESRCRERRVDLEELSRRRVHHAEAAGGIDGDHAVGEVMEDRVGDFSGPVQCVLDQGLAVVAPQRDDEPTDLRIVAAIDGEGNHRLVLASPVQNSQGDPERHMSLLQTHHRLERFDEVLLVHEVGDALADEVLPGHPELCRHGVVAPGHVVAAVDDGDHVTQPVEHGFAEVVLLLGRGVGGVDGGRRLEMVSGEQRKAAEVLGCREVHHPVHRECADCRA